jgi:hypothetical protein
MVFEFLVRYLGFMKHVPFAAWVMDALLFIWYSAFRREVLRAICKIETEVSAWIGIKVTLHRFGGLQFNYSGKEIGHIHSNGILDILLNRSTKNILLEKGLASDHHVFPDSGWISFYVRQDGDVDKALGLLELSYRKSRTRTLGNQSESRYS